MNENPKTNRPKKYGQPLKVKGTFMDIMKAAGKDAKSKNAPVKAYAEKQ
jgi:hypothetical protein